MRIKHYFRHHASASYDLNSLDSMENKSELIPDELNDLDQASRRFHTLPSNFTAAAKLKQQVISSIVKPERSSSSASRSSSVPSLQSGTTGNSGQIPAGSGRQIRTSSVDVSPRSGTTRAIIERTKSSRAKNPDQLKTGSLPRKRGNLFVKAGQAPRRYEVNPAQQNHNPEQVQTLPRSYKHNEKTVLEKSMSITNLDHTRGNPETEIDPPKFRENPDSSGVNLVVSAGSFVSNTLPKTKKVKPILTVQETLSQDLQSLPPQVIIPKWCPQTCCNSFTHS